SIDDETQLPARATLEANYPNPFATNTTIRYSLPEPTSVHLVVYDGLGREVRTILNTTQAAGHWAVPFDATGLANGLYHIRLVTPQGQSAQTMHLVR
ncbi:MAG: T9SS type A sorting domain-containing protein, partial [Bacteroidota bacterium]